MGQRATLGFSRKHRCIRLRYVADMRCFFGVATCLDGSFRLDQLVSPSFHKYVPCVLYNEIHAVSYTVNNVRLHK